MKNKFQKIHFTGYIMNLYIINNTLLILGKLHLYCLTLFSKIN